MGADKKNNSGDLGNLAPQKARVGDCCLAFLKCLKMSENVRNSGGYFFSSLDRNNH
jgi:hypothetical protein